MITPGITAGILFAMFLTAGFGNDTNDHPPALNQGQIYAETIQDEPDEPEAEQTVTIPRDVIHPDYEDLLNENDELDICDRSVEELLELIGEPPHLLRQGHRGSGWHKEVWILPIYQKDSTGLYIYMEDGKVADWRLDTFMGIGNHKQLLDWF